MVTVEIQYDYREKKSRFLCKKEKKIIIETIKRNHVWALLMLLQHLRISLFAPHTKKISIATGTELCFFSRTSKMPLLLRDEQV